MTRLVGLCFVSLLLLLTGRAFGVAVVGYYYTGTINGTQALQMKLDVIDSVIGGSYQNVTGQSLKLVPGAAPTATQVRLREFDEATKSDISSFIGTLTDNRQSFTGTWRNADGKQTFPFSLQAIAEYRRISRTIKLDAKVEKARKEAGKTPDRVVEETYPYFYRATPALTRLNQLLNESAEKELQEAEKEAAGTLPILGTSYQINYFDARLLSMSVVTTTEGSDHDGAIFAGENIMLTGELPSPVTLDDLFTPTPALRDELLTKVHDAARKLTADEAEAAQFDKSKVKWEDINLLLNAKYLTFCYPREQGTRDSYHVVLSYVDLLPYLAEDGLLKDYLPKTK